MFRGVRTRFDEICLPFRWLDTTPTARVITRVTQDIRACMFCLFFLLVRGLNAKILLFSGWPNISCLLVVQRYQCLDAGQGHCRGVPYTRVYLPMH